jgi:hypothetical protein
MILQGCPRQWPVEIRSPVPEESPCFLQRLHAGEIELGKEDLLRVSSLRGDPTGRIGDEGTAPEGDGSFMTDTICGCDVNCVGCCVTQLYSFPHTFPVPGDIFLYGTIKDADGCGIDQKLCSSERRDPCSLGEPLVETNERGNFPIGRVYDSDSRIAGAEVPLLVIQDVFGNMRFSVGPKHLPIRPKHWTRIVVSPLLCLLEDRSADQDDPVLRSRCTQRLRGRPRDRLRGGEGIHVIWPLAEVGAEEELGECHDLCPALGSLGDRVEGFCEILLARACAGHLDKAEGDEALLYDAIVLGVDTQCNSCTHFLEDSACRSTMLHVSIGNRI